MKVLIDTNVILDFLMEREPYKTDAVKIIKMCAEKKLEGYLAAHTISNLFFILRKQFDIPKRREILLSLCRIFNIPSLDKNVIMISLKNDEFSDFEDCLQMESAKIVEADYIITRNPSDFKASKIMVIEPSEFLEQYSE